MVNNLIQIINNKNVYSNPVVPAHSVPHGHVSFSQWPVPLLCHVIKNKKKFYKYPL